MHLLKDITINLTDKREKVPIVILSDVHLGNENCNIEKLDQYIKWIKANDVYVIYMGDIIEMQINFKQMDAIWGADMTPNEQLKETVAKFAGLKNLIYLEGNHEFRLRRMTSIDAADLIARAIGAEYAEYGTFFKLNINKISYDIVAVHGSRSSRNPEYQLKLYDQIFDGYDILMIGHIHQLYHRQKSRLELKNGKLEARRIHWIRTGSFLKYTDYAFRDGMEVCVNDVPILFLNTKEKLINVHTGGLRTL